MRNPAEEARAPRGLMGEHAAMVVGPVWDKYVPIRVKGHRVIALSGQDTYSSEFLEVPLAVGIVEVTGVRVGHQHASLRVGFSLAETLPEPSFIQTENEAVGTLVLPVSLFHPWLIVLGQPAYFRIGGDGKGNAVSSDLSFLS